MPIAVEPTFPVGESGDAARDNHDRRGIANLGSIGISRGLPPLRRVRPRAATLSEADPPEETRTRTTVTHAISRLGGWEA